MFVFGPSKLSFNRSKFRPLLKKGTVVKPVRSLERTYFSFIFFNTLMMDKLVDFLKETSVKKTTFTKYCYPHHII